MEAELLKKTLPQSNTGKRSVIILGTNSQKYLDFALCCAHSVKYHNPHLKVYIATNLLPKKSYPGIDFIAVEDKIAKLYIETKLYIDTFLQTDETLYIDSDSLCFGSLDPIFEACKDMDVTVLGKLISVEEYWGEASEFAKNKFNINSYILFNGGLYFIKKTPLTTKIYDKARSLSENYDSLGFGRIRDNWKNEEDLMCIGMLTYGQLPIEHSQHFVGGISTESKPIKIDVLKGHAILEISKTKGVKDRISPILIHFGGENIYTYPYLSQSTLLKLNNIGFPVFLANTIVNIGIHAPFKLYKIGKQILNKIVR